ncbi:glycerol-3-phosphate acyltransferase [Bacillus sp. S/N-304-OC-R1]|uniref:glycerol-3-phosphate acyltransferase n=1 Tax=Bacillus sp. S/N-304-OC-R1 TaxID=2758034 RepID=UPI001C8DAAB9|nr:glycerol-3-phosphate acyltransferase [Bacillus sp. S/N-304-OC-R1]MBY0120362.1 glycerol-3-phosphate acyltransferase [Bacillus sp. S/N-304-OC-R1]
MNFLSYLITSYFIGNILTAHLLIKLLRKENIINQGSGNPGARNIGRLYGKKAFIITFLGDALKGCLVVLIGRYFLFSEFEILACLTVAVIGHIKPIFYRLKGGKGISTFIGGIITFEPLLALVIIIGFLLFYSLSKSFTISGLAAFCFIPFAVSYLYHSTELLWVLVVLIVILIFAHSDNLLKKINHT